MSGPRGMRDGDSVDELLWIDDLCDRFEDACQAGQSSVSGFLRQAGLDPGKADLNLLRELRRVAAEYEVAPVENGSTVSEARGVNGSFRDVEPGIGDTAIDLPPPPTDHGIRGYRLLGRIAEGGMGVVYRAHEPSFGRDVAVKVLRDQFRGNEAATRRFVAEARLTGRLQHPGVPPVFEVGTLADGSPFLAMKLIAGQTLAHALDSPKRSDTIAPIAAFEHLCQTVAYAHARGIIHRDLKPSNIMVGEFGEVQVMDWGLAKDLAAGESESGRREDAGALQDREAPGSEPTRTGSVVGSPPYMPPEQARGEIHEVDQRSDVFGLGAILCEMLTGSPAFVGKSREVTLQLAAGGKVQECFSRLDVCGADPELVSLCKRCLSPAKAERPADAGEVAKAVAGLRLAADERARRAELDRAKAELKADEQRKRRRVQLLLAGAIGLLVVGLGAFGWWQDRQRTEAKVRDRDERERRERNGEAVTALLDRATEALKSRDPAKTAEAAVALDAAAKRSADGGAEHLKDRLEGLRADLVLLQELEAVEQFSWTLMENKAPTSEVIASRYREVMGRFGADPDATPTDRVAARICASAVKDRLVAVLDLVLAAGKSDRVRLVLRAVDPDPYRDAVRDAFQAGDARRLTELVAQAALQDQPPSYVATISRSVHIPVERRRELLRAAVVQHPRDLELLMHLGFTYRAMERKIPNPEDNRENKLADERIRWFQAAVGVAPKLITAHCALAHALHDKGDRAGAEAEFREAVHIDPNHAQARCYLGTFLLNKGDRVGAEVEFRKAIRIDPNYVWGHYSLGTVLIDKKDPVGAEVEFREALRIDPNIATTHVQLGNLFWDKGDRIGAEAEFREAIRADPNLVMAHIHLGNLLRDKGDRVGAEAEFREAVRSDVNDALAHYNLGIVLLVKGDPVGAEKECRETLRINPNYAPAHNNLGYLLDVNGDSVGAEVEFRQAIHIDPNFIGGHHNLGILLLKKVDRTGAETEFREVIRIDPKRADAFYNLASVLRLNGDLNGAIDAWREAARLQPNAPRSVDLGLALFQRGRPDEAEKEFREVIRLNPLDNQAHRNLGILLSRRGAHVEAVAAYREGIRVAQINRVAPSIMANYHWELANALWSKGDRHEALVPYRAAVALDPKNDKYHASLGAMLLSLGDLDGAASSFRAAVQLVPTNENHRQTLKQVEVWRELLPRLASIVEGQTEPKTPREACEFAWLCTQPFQKRYLDAVRLYEKAFAVDPKLANYQLTEGHRYNAACAAVLAGSGAGVNAPVDPDERSALRAKAINWLRADLVLNKSLAASSSASDRKTAAVWLAHWQGNPSLATTRPGFARIVMSADERADWDKLWEEVRATLAVAQKLTAPTAAPTPREKK